MKQSIRVFLLFLGVGELFQRGQGLVLLPLQPPPPRCVSRREGLWTAARACFGITTAATATATATATIVLPSSQVSALDIPPPSSLFVEGRVALAPDATIETTSGQTNALYITVRPNRADNVPAAVLSGTSGKPPPVLAARFENPTFPYEFKLTPADVTPEGAGTGESSSNYWWSQDDLVVSARWDWDGIAATRSPEDLVGRATLSRSSQSDKSVLVQLHGRGAFGKFATQKK
eukprot:scaffold2934_cov176-Amphora_coffeaeformis.AAC.3